MVGRYLEGGILPFSTTPQFVDCHTEYKIKLLQSGIFRKNGFIALKAWLSERCTLHVQAQNQTHKTLRRTLLFY